jgi:hypothetical protein
MNFRRLKKMFLEHPVISSILVGGVILFLNLMCLLVGPIIFPGESGMILLFPLIILNFPVFGYHYYGDFDSWLLICFFLSPAFYFLCVYFIVHALNKGWRNRKHRYSMSLASAVIILILLGGVFAKSITLSSAMKKLERDDINSYERWRQSDIVFRYSSEKHIPDIIKLLTTIPENDSYSIDAKRNLIQALQNLRAKEGVPVLLELIKTSNNEVAEKAIEAVGAIEGPDEAIPLIVKYIEKNNYRFICFLQPLTFKKYRADPKLAQALLQVCNNMGNNEFQQACVLEALAYVADYEMLLKVRELYKNELNKVEYFKARQEIEKELQKKRVYSESHSERK